MINAVETDRRDLNNIKDELDDHDDDEDLNDEERNYQLNLLRQSRAAE